MSLSGINKIENYKIWIVLLIINYMFIDFIRRFFDGSSLILAFLDLNILIIFLLFFYKKRIRLAKKTKISLFFLFLMLNVGAVLIQIINFSHPDLLAILIGLRSYILAVPFLWIGYHLFYYKDFSAVIVFSKIILYLSMISIAYGIFSFIVDPAYAGGVIKNFITPMGHSAHSFNSSSQELVSSFFASSSKFSVFLLISYLIIWGERRQQGKSIIIIFVVFLIGFFISGNRTGITLFILFNTLVMLTMTTYKEKFLVFLSIALTVILTVMIGSFSKSEYKDTFERIDYMMEDTSEYLVRLNQAIPLSHINFNNDILFGSGLGTYGQEALFRSETEPSEQALFEYFFHKNQYHIKDSGITKVTIELGLFGLFFFLLFLGVLATLSLIVIVKAIKFRNYLAFSIACIPGVWILLMLKGHPIMSDIVISSSLYLSIGCILAFLRSKNALETFSDSVNFSGKK
jgi:hypothetical protein